MQPVFFPHHVVLKKKNYTQGHILSWKSPGILSQKVRTNPGTTVNGWLTEGGLLHRCRGWNQTCAGQRGGWCCRHDQATAGRR